MVLKNCYECAPLHKYPNNYPFKKVLNVYFAKIAFDISVGAFLKMKITQKCTIMFQLVYCFV